MRLKPFLFALCFIAAGISQAQILKPAKWSTSSSSVAARVGDEIELIFKATIDKDWYLYSSGFDPNCGPMVTAFTFKPNKSYTLVGKIIPINPLPKHDEVFDCDVKIFKKNGEFRQKVRVLSADLRIEGSYEYQVCTDIDGKCIPFDEEFVFDQVKVSAKDQSAKQKVESGSSASVTDSLLNQVKAKTTAESYGKNKGPVLDRTILEGASSYEHTSLLGYLLFAFVVGLTSLITPCVFPMIPMTVTFFLKDNQTRSEGVKKAIIFGLSIIVIYTRNRWPECTGYALGTQSVCVRHLHCFCSFLLWFV